MENEIPVKKVKLQNSRKIAPLSVELSQDYNNLTLQPQNKSHDDNTSSRISYVPDNSVNLQSEEKVEETNAEGKLIDPEKKPFIDRISNQSSFGNMCRICFERRNVENTEIQLGSLISPCKCSGSVRYIHDTCLKN